MNAAILNINFDFNFEHILITLLKIININKIYFLHNLILILYNTKTFLLIYFSPIYFFLNPLNSLLLDYLLSKISLLSNNQHLLK